MSSVKKNFVYNSLYQLLVILVPLITTPYISRVLGPSKLGEYSYSYSIAAYFVTFAMMGLSNYGNRTIASLRDNRKQLSKTFSEIFCMQFLTSLIVVGVYIIFVLFFSGDIMAWIMFFYVLSAIMDINWFFQGLELFKITVTRNILIKLLSTISIFVLVREQSDVYLYGIIMAVAILISHLSIWPFLKKYVDFTKVSFKEVLKHFKPNLILFIPAIAVSVYKLMDKIMLGAFSELQEVGFYESAEKLVQIPNALVISLGTVMLPKMANLASKKNKGQAEEYLYKSFLLVMFMSTSMSFGIMSVADNLVPIFFGKGYEKCVVLIQFLLCSCIFVAFANVIRTQYLIPQKKDKIYIQSVFLGAFTNLIINSLLIQSYKSIGVAIGTLLTEAIVCIYQIVKVRKELHIWEYVKVSIPFLMSGVLMYAVLIQIHFESFSPILELMLRIIIGAILYLATLILMYLVMKFGKWTRRN